MIGHERLQRGATTGVPIASAFPDTQPRHRERKGKPSFSSSEDEILSSFSISVAEKTSLPFRQRKFVETKIPKPTLEHQFAEGSGHRGHGDIF
mmetsp:Transcript_10552/g.21668  ORF Transcript_10552/g.21668 Transcript_10552/m.21668 type:complete len:93 (-) Transcript_10552:14-292(-)